MPMHSDRRRHQRTRRRKSELDWFGEDPWADPESAASQDDEDDYYPGLWEPGNAEQAASGAQDDEMEAWDEDSFDDWGPVRLRRGSSRTG
jgi:hypothetical protein